MTDSQRVDLDGILGNNAIFMPFVPLTKYRHVDKYAQRDVITKISKLFEALLN